MDIRGTEQDDSYDLTAAGPTEWHDYYGLGGNDLIRMWSGQVIGGPGNDRIEQIPSTDLWNTLSVAYWDAPAGAVVDLAAGTAQDGWGTVDTLIGVDDVNGGGRDDRFYGNADANSFSPGGGKDLIDGRGGLDSLTLSYINGSLLTLGDLSISVSIDGRSATLTTPRATSFRLDLIDVERFRFDWDLPFMNLADFISPFALASQGLVGLAEQRWNASSAVGTATSVSFSFVETAPTSGPGASGFRPFTSAERQVVRDMLNATSALTGLSVVEVNETSTGSGQMRFGVSAQAQTMGVAYPPSLSSANPSAGDVWMDTDSMLSLAVGSQGYAALRHEIGHALGLRHPSNVDPGDAWSQQFRAADDQTSLTVMSGNASVDGLFPSDWGSLDVLALRYLYGTAGVNLGDNSYQVGQSDAHAQRTLVDDGGIDSVNAAASPVGVAINLVPGRSSSVGVTAQGLIAVDNLGLSASSWLENAVGSIYDDVLTGNSLANILEGGLGNDWIDGGAGLDTAVFASKRSDYVLSKSFGTNYALAKDGSSGFDTLLNIERLQFTDTTVILDISGVAGQAYRIYQAAFNRTPDNGGLKYWIGLMDGGYTLAGVASGFIASAEFKTLYGSNPTNELFVSKLYDNVLHRTPDEGGYNYWVGLLNTNKIDSISTLINFSESTENQAGVIGVIQNGIELLN